MATIKEIKWLILGGSGQLGRAMGDLLKRNVCDYTSLNHRELDILDRQAVQKTLKRIKPTIVVNFAAWTNVDLAETNEVPAHLVNAVGPGLLAKDAATIEARFIHLSTDYVFSGESKTPWREDAIKAPVSVYGKTKSDGEKLVYDSYPHGSYIIRTSWLYSPWGKNFVKSILKIAIEESRRIEVVNDQVGQPTSAIELVEKIYQLGIKDVSPGIYHFTNSGQASWFQLAQEIFRVCGEDPNRVVPVTSEFLSRPAKRPSFSVLKDSMSEQMGLRPMQTWDTALKAALPSIILNLNSE